MFDIPVTIFILVRVGVVSFSTSILSIRERTEVVNVVSCYCIQCRIIALSHLQLHSVFVLTVRVPATVAVCHGVAPWQCCNAVSVYT